MSEALETSSEGVEAGKGIRLHIAGPRAVREGEVGPKSNTQSPVGSLENRTNWSVHTTNKQLSSLQPLPPPW